MKRYDMQLNKGILMNKSSINQETRIMPVYDITNCGSRSRYMANGKLVHNSDKVNLQNLSARGKDPVLRRSLRAMDGFVVLASDSGQIECLAGDGLVLTNNGLKQIVNISIDDLLWDGVEYVSHNGVIFKGVKDVITYSGITATPEHIVFTADGRKITLDEAAAERAEILVGERAGQPIRAVGEVHLWNRETCQSERFTAWQEQELQSVQQSQVLAYTKKASRPTANALQRFTGRGNLITGTISVYDIVNAGVRNRFCYNGMIVSNCRINGLMSNQQDLTQLFLAGRDPYVDMATAIFNRPYDEILHEAKVVGSKEGKKMRNLGKEAVLACISHDTEVLCKRGWVAIQDIKEDDLLWDGEDWVTHDGVVPMGSNECIDFGGVMMTPDHKCFNGHKWEQAQYADVTEVTNWAIGNLPDTE